MTWTATKPTPAPTTSAAKNIARLPSISATAVLDALYSWQEHRAQRRRLAEIDERTLRDIGVTRQAALDAYTNGSAWFSFDEDWMGRLEPGMAADLAVLDRDYFTIPEDEIPEIRSRLTLVDGAAVHADDGIEMEVS